MTNREYVEYNLSKVTFYQGFTTLKFQDGTSRGMSISLSQFEKIKTILKEVA